MIIKKNYVMIRRKNNNDKECSVESSLEVGMLSKSTFNDQELDNYLRQGEIKASEKPPVPPQILWVGDCTIATFGNFSASTGKAKSKKTFNITAMVAAAVFLTGNAKSFISIQNKAGFIVTM